jgi:aspartate ammonia-lyase
MLRIRLNRENECTKGSIFGVQTLSAKQNFQIKGNGLNKTFIKNIARIKRAAAITNCKAKRLSPEIAYAIEAASK